MISFIYWINYGVQIEARVLLNSSIGVFINRHALLTNRPRVSAASTARCYPLIGNDRHTITPADTRVCPELLHSPLPPQPQQPSQFNVAEIFNTPVSHLTNLLSPSQQHGTIIMIKEPKFCDPAAHITVPKRACQKNQSFTSIGL